MKFWTSLPICCALDRDRLLTTRQAADLLGIRSMNTLKLLLRREQVPTVRRGNRTMVALGEVERLQDSERVRGIRASDAAHDPVEDRPIHSRAGHVLLRIVHHQFHVTLVCPGLECSALYIRADVALAAAVADATDADVAVNWELEIAKRRE